MLRAAQAGKLVGLSREAPEQPDPVLYKQLVSPRTPLLSKNSCSVAPLFPLLFQHSDSLRISTEIPLYFFFLDFCLLLSGFDWWWKNSSSLAWVQRWSMLYFWYSCQALKLSSLSLILQRLVISVTKDRLFTNQEMTFARNSCHKSPFPCPSVHEPAEMSQRKSRNWIVSDLQEHSAFWSKGLCTWGYLRLPHFNLLVFLDHIKPLVPC